MLALIVLVPGPVVRTLHTKAARGLVEEIASGREELLAGQEEFRAPLEVLGDPVQSWTTVSCTLAPRYSDGDGESDIVMSYRQRCALVATEIYPTPPGAGDIEQVSRLLGARVVREPTCSQSLHDVLPGDGRASNPRAYSASLWWVDPDGVPPDRFPDSCALPTPDSSDPDVLVRGIDGPAPAGPVVAFSVRSPSDSVGVGCERGLSRIYRCEGKPEGFPVY